MNLCLLALTLAVIALPQDTTSLFKCPDGKLVPLEVKGRPYRCPDTDEQREANQAAEWASQSRERLKAKSEEWEKAFSQEHSRNVEELKNTAEKQGLRAASVSVDNRITANVRLADTLRQEAENEIAVAGLERKAKIENIVQVTLREMAFASNEALASDEKRSATFAIDSLESKETFFLDMTKTRYEDELADQSTKRSQASADRARAAELAKLAPVCHAVYQATIDKASGLITVRESEQIATCRKVGLYK